MMISTIAHIGLIGLGGYAQEHLAILNTLHDAGLCRLVGAADPFAARHPSLANALQGRDATICEDWQELLARPDIDAVFIATPIHWHARQAIAALQAGKSVYLEKPPCATLGEWTRMMEAQRASGQVCAVGFQMQQSGALRFLKSQIAAGALGRLQHAWTSVRWRRDDAYYARSNWAGRWFVDGAPVFDGPATNAISHAVQALISLCATGDEATVLARVRGTLKRARAVESYDSAFLEAETAQGVHLRLAFTHATAATDPVVLRLSGDEGEAEVAWNGRVSLKRNGETREQQFLDAPSWGATLDFLRSLHGSKGAPLVSLRDTLPYLQMVNGALQSSHGAQDFPDESVERIGDGAPDTYYSVRGMDEEFAAFGGDFHQPPRSLSSEDHPWLEAAQLHSDLSVG